MIQLLLGSDNNKKGGIIMHPEFLDAIYEYCCDNKFDFIIKENTSGNIQFVQEYINPMLQADQETGFKMETMFNIALAESSAQEFKNGFRTCMRFLLESLFSETK